MIADGLFERFPVDSVYAIHNFPSLETARFAVRAGSIMAAEDNFEITKVGTGKIEFKVDASGNAYLAGVLRIGFGTYFEAFMLAGLLCVAAALMVLFIGIVAWAWSGKRKARFDAAAQLPFDEDPLVPTNNTSKENSHG